MTKENVLPKAEEDTRGLGTVNNIYHPLPPDGAVEAGPEGVHAVPGDD